MYWVYAIKSLATGRIYIGQTKDFQGGLREHNASTVRSTNKDRPWELYAWEVFTTRKEAMYVEWRIKRSKGLRQKPVAINLSGRSLSEPSLPQYIGDELRTCGINPARLIVEITETAAVSHLHDAQRLIEALHQLGCGVSLDDFGVGFASFAYLKHLAIDTIKLDGIFIRDLANDPDNQVFVQAMVSVALGLGKSVVAEYVEDARTLALLRNFGVDMVQGYHLDRPTADHPALQGKA